MIALTLIVLYLYIGVSVACIYIDRKGGQEPYAIWECAILPIAFVALCVLWPAILSDLKIKI